MVILGCVLAKVRAYLAKYRTGCYLPQYKVDYKYVKGPIAVIRAFPMTHMMSPELVRTHKTK